MAFNQLDSIIFNCYFLDTCYEFRLHIAVITIWLFNIAMERSTIFTIFKNGKPSISMGHLYHGYVSHKQKDPEANSHYIPYKSHINPI